MPLARSLAERQERGRRAAILGRSLKRRGFGSGALVKSGPHNFVEFAAQRCLILAQ